MSDNLEFNKSQRKAWLTGIDFEVFAEAVIEQMNSLRMQKVNLVQDMDDIVNDYMQVCKKYPDEPYYVNLQDCVLLKKSLQEFINGDDEFTSFAYFHDTLHEETRHEYQYMKKVFSNTKYFLPNPSTTFIACFGPMYVIKNSMMKRLLNSGILENMKSVCKVDDETGERIFGLIAEQEGYNPLHFNMEGDIMSKWNSMLSNNLEYFTKKFLGRT